MDKNIEQAVEFLKNSRHTTVFSGAGISVESGIPSFRGEKGLWNKYDPKYLDIDYFIEHPESSWKIIKEIFYDFFSTARPNDAHFVIAKLEKKSIVKTVITQNIDNLHQEAGSKNVIEFHGNSKQLVCTDCNLKYRINDINLEILPPKCMECNGLLKPDFIFFGEGIPEPANTLSFKEADVADVFLVIGTTGEVMPACLIPQIAKNNGCLIIEINPVPSLYTRKITDIYIQGNAGSVMNEIMKLV